MSIIGPVLSVRERVRFRFLGRFMGLIQFWVELESGYDVKVCASLCLRFRIWWSDTKMKEWSSEHWTVLGQG